MEDVDRTEHRGIVPMQRNSFILQKLTATVTGSFKLIVPITDQGCESGSGGSG